MTFDGPGRPPLAETGLTVIALLFFGREPGRRAPRALVPSCRASVAHHRAGSGRRLGRPGRPGRLARATSSRRQENARREQEDFPLETMLETPRVSERVTTRIKMRARLCLCALLLGSSLAINVIDVDSEMIDTMINGERNVLLM